MLMKLHNRQTGSDRQMQAASKEINQICERLRLNDIVKNSALEVFRDVSALCLGVAPQSLQQGGLQESLILCIDACACSCCSSVVGVVQRVG